MRPTIYLPQPCHESWDAMTSTAAGRHCAACQMEVVDFTSMTDGEVLVYLAQANHQPVCGRLLPSQLGRPLVARPAPPRWRAWLPALVATISLEALLPAWGIAQTIPPPAQVAAADTYVPPVAAPATTRAPATAVRIEGTVVDEHNELLPGVTVLLEGTKVGTTTDAAGKFVLSVAPTRAKSFLVVSFVGYETVRRRIDFQAPGKPVVLKLQSYVLGGFGFTAPPPTLWQQLAHYFARKNAVQFPEASFPAPPLKPDLG